MCCRADSGSSPNVNNPYETAGYWGGLGVCDLPSVDIESLTEMLTFGIENL